MPHSYDITPLASAARTTSGVSPALSIAPATLARLTLDVTAASGTTPKLDVTIETAKTATATTWRSLGAFTQATAVGAEEKRFGACDAQIRVRWTITGAGASFTFSVAGQSFIVYGSPTRLKSLSIPDRALVNEYNQDYTDEELWEFCEAATDEGDGYLGAQYELPLAAWRSDLEEKTMQLAAFKATQRRGFNPEEPGANMLLKMRDDSLAWLKMIARGELEPPGIVDSTPDEEDGGVYVVSDGSRGW